MCPMTGVQKEQDIEYPDSDGLPMADNTKQFEWITVLVGNLNVLYRHNPNVFVAGDLLWYPVKGNNKICRAPDAMTVHGRPKGHRGSYKQWEEGDIAPQVVFEVLSPSNTDKEMQEKRDFYNTYGVEEFYSYAPETNHLCGWLRSQRTGQLEEIVEMHRWTSTRLQIRFDVLPDDLYIYTPQGEPFLTFTEVVEQREQAQQREKQAYRIAKQSRREVDQARREVDQARREADQARRENDKLREKLRTLGIDPDA